MSEKTIYEMDILSRREEELKPLKIFIDENKVWTRGVIVDEFKFEHEKWNEKFYTTRVKVKRLSGVEDNVPIIVSERLIPNTSVKGKMVDVGGIFHAYRKRNKDRKKRTELYVFANIIKIYDSEETPPEDVMNINAVYLQGEIDNIPVLRTTPNGRNVADILLKVKSGENLKISYIPCIVWGQNAYNICKQMEFYKTIEVYGKIQSHQYKKKDKIGGEFPIEAYELSISHIETMKIPRRT